jgi:DNA invertase Pin-like site-specific DNA recombinase
MSRRERRGLESLLAKVQKRRCAIYTRVSTDEQTNREYNSLHAQRDACEAYVASQRAEGWVLVEDRYERRVLRWHHGPAGATSVADRYRDRPNQCSGNYKIDRLSRSLIDFLKLVEKFEQHGVTFVSVTQSFNTTTSMGHLVLIILAGFAQYEREAIGERIRDKFAASRARHVDGRQGPVWL